MRYAGAGGVGLAIVACLAGCGAESDRPGGPETGRPSAPARSSATAQASAAADSCPAPEITSATGNPAPQAAVQAAARYLAVRESRLSTCRPTTTSWEAEAKPLMTAKGWRDHPGPPPEAGRLRKELLRNRWNVRATVSCRANPEAGRGTATSQPLFCALADTTVTAAGKPVSAFQVPASWLYTGDRDPGLLSMKKQGGAWLVDGDYTGRAQ